MKARGWALVVDGLEHHDGVVYMKDGGPMLYLTMVNDGGRTMLTAIETARTDTPTLAEVHVEN